MGARLPSVSTTTVLGVSITGSGESVICTTPPISPILPNTQILIQWYAAMIINSTGTTIGWRIRRGTTTAGQLINVTALLPSGAAIIMAFGGCYVDSPGDVAGQQYSLCALLAGGGGNGGGTDCCMTAMVL